MSFGDPVDPSAVRVLSPFQHPRVLIKDFNGGERVMQYAFREVLRMSLFRPLPVVVVHPDVDLDDGLTQIEARALREMVEGAGARKVNLHYGRQLSDQEVAGFSFQDIEALL